MVIKPVILTRSLSGCQTSDWKRELAAAFTRPEALLDALELDRSLLAEAHAGAAQFRLLVPRGFAALMERGNPLDPLLRQVLPVGAELRKHPGFPRDPVGDRAALRAKGLLQKYRGRALVTATGACAINCRYCFRRHFPYGEHNAVHDHGSDAIAWLAASTDVTEVILSGGDPLMLDDDRLDQLTRKLQSIPHLRRLRIHTRLPIVLPSRVTPRLCRSLAGSRLTPVVVVHANHPRELGLEAKAALGRLRDAGIALLNQSVLLKGVNDSAPVLADLSEGLFASGVIPYYLHLLDRVSGATHFEVKDSHATQLIEALRARLPGYLVPRLVREEAGQPGKTVIM